MVSLAICMMLHMPSYKGTQHGDRNTDVVVTDIILTTFFI